MVHPVALILLSGKDVKQIRHEIRHGMYHITEIHVMPIVLLACGFFTVDQVLFIEIIYSLLSSGSHTFCHPASRTAFLSLTRFWRIRERLCMNRVKSLSSIRCMSLGYIFEPKLSIRALGTVGSVVNINSSLNGCSHTKTQFDAKKQD